MRHIGRLLVAALMAVAALGLVTARPAEAHYFGHFRGGYGFGFPGFYGPAVFVAPPPVYPVYAGPAYLPPPPPPMIYRHRVVVVRRHYRRVYHRVAHHVCSCGCCR